jgi:uncharacterized linocin/CFP29 family protein
MTRQATPLTEEAWQNQVIDLAKLFKWHVHHGRPARTGSGGWATAIQGHKGFPDLVLARDGRVIFAELKTDDPRSRLRPEQAAWLDALGLDQLRDGPEVYVWRPRDRRTVEEKLR